MRRRTGPGSGRSASKSSRMPGRTAARGPWSAWPARDAWPGRGHPESCRRLRPPWVSTDPRPPGSSPAPPRSEKVLEVIICPPRRRGGPRDLQAAGDRVTALARAERAPPAEALLLEAGRFAIRTQMGLRAGAVSLAECVATRDERHRLLVVHRHALECLADIRGRRDRIWIAVRALRVDVDQPHLNGRERSLEIPDTGVALVGQPLILGAPVNVLVRFPDIRSPAGEAEGLETHRFQRDVAREDQEVGP